MGNRLLRVLMVQEQNAVARLQELREALHVVLEALRIEVKQVREGALQHDHPPPCPDRPRPLGIAGHVLGIAALLHEAVPVALGLPESRSHRLREIVLINDNRIRIAGWKRVNPCRRVNQRLVIEEVLRLEKSQHGVIERQEATPSVVPLVRGGRLRVPFNLLQRLL